MKFLINTRRQYLTLIVIAVLQRLVIQELETRVQQLTQESEGLQSSRSKLEKEKVIKFNTVALVVVTCGSSVCTGTSVAVILSRETYFRCILMLINSFKFILEACDIVAVGMHFCLTTVISRLPKQPTQTEFLAFQSSWLVYTNQKQRTQQNSLARDNTFCIK